MNTIIKFMKRNYKALLVIVALSIALLSFIPKEKTDPESWAWEGHAMATRLTYGLLKPQIPVEQPGETNCDAEKAKVAALHLSIGDDYVNRSLPAVREQLAHAAARLANLLNQTF